MPKSKKKKPGNGRSKQFETIFCLAELGLLILVWILRIFLQATAGEILVVYLAGTIAVIVALSAINRRAADRAMDILGKP